MRFGGPTIARRQLQNLVEMSEWDNVTIRVIPFSAGGFPGSGQSIFYSAGPVQQLDTIHLDQCHGPVFLHTAAQFDKHRVLLDRTEAKALSPTDSQDLIHRAIQRL
ncbi:hypothetical protein RKD44_004129 [Streptomyces collinus]